MAAPDDGDGTPERRKRPRGTPTFRTPNRPAKRQSIREVASQEQLVLPVSRLSLRYQNPLRGVAWTDEECHALVSFLMLMTDGEKWPSHKSKPGAFWDRAGEFVQRTSKTVHRRSGKKIYNNILGVG